MTELIRASITVARKHTNLNSTRYCIQYSFQWLRSKNLSRSPQQASCGVADSPVHLTLDISSMSSFQELLTASPAEYVSDCSVLPGATDPLMTSYNESIYFDRAFYAQDIAGSIAFARANVATGILSPDEFATIERGLNEVLEEWRTDKFVIQPGVDEDIHTANERRLGEIIGKDVGGKLHTWVAGCSLLPDETSRDVEKTWLEIY